MKKQRKSTYLKLKRALKEKEELLDLFFSQSQDGFFFMIIDEPVYWNDEVDKEKVMDYVFAHQRITKVNSAMLKQYGYTKDEFLGLTPNDLFAYNPNYGKELWVEFFDHGKVHFDTDERKKDGTQIWIEGDYTCLYDAQGRIIGHFGIQREVTEKKTMEKELKRIAESQALLLDNIDHHIWYLKSYDTYGLVNKAHANFYRLNIEKVENQSIYNFMSKKEADRCIESNKRVFKERKKICTEEELTNYKGKLRTFSIVKTPYIGKDGNVEYVICCAEDITERKQKEAQLKHLSLYDQLTGLYNRNYFEAQIKKLIDVNSHPISVISCDLDGLKIINDTIGHENGDKLLKICADILRKFLRTGDTLARTGGDEFSILLNKTTKRESEKIVSEIRNSVNYYNLKNQDLPLSLSLGTATTTISCKSLNDTLKKADEKMYHEKLIQKRSSRSQIIDSLMAALAEKDYITEGHSHRISEYCIEIGEKFNLASNIITNLNLLAQVHDLGKVGIPDSILLKAGPLTSEEWEIMKKHSEKGYRIAISSPDLAKIADLILKHHEKWDGTGYPLKIKGAKIPIECRILAVVDAFDAMTSNRPYNKPKSKSEAIKELKRCAGTQFDPDIVKLFLRILSNEKD
ncbi:PAS domain S-box-containing protein/diguanylate cyclase (GGDEF) domain-containing protein [Desulfonispora thiosulfatigenes DSM 11270]|uniref:PAS domain S-box-containing protein/diguanylate cyclase (GGDEF) domain-containing protein n=1 Tax=Desulfonispora thiosulfatigenes DSM 11270 TaxID=656914 RepID=A0A1W1UQ91_DESTI|nr:HD domain-containing phosphohydrolase [Desulfonispora thiosulfatigenes]SMB82971.1 PAS domain S-box-containing protein/diguanylate cyclase (GGDEF) domain-containing protein [Desulfonispora thiosulfatigenes DSM 11270]